MQRHLAAFEAAEAHAGARGLALAAAAGLSCPCRSRCRGRRARGSCAIRRLSLSSLRRIGVRSSCRIDALSLVVDHAHEVADLVDHAAHGRRILERAPAAHLVEAETDQRLLPGSPGRRLALAICSTVTVLPASCAASCRLLSCHRTSPRFSRLARGLAVAGRAVAAAGHDLAHLLAAPRRHRARVLLRP